MKITLTIDPIAHPELTNELKGIAPRLRSERLRTLAVQCIQYRDTMQSCFKSIPQQEAAAPIQKNQRLGAQLKKNGGFSM